MKKFLKIFLIKLLPKNFLSRLVGFLANRRISWMAIRPFSSAYNINLDEAEYPLRHYKTLNAFFTRKLKPGVRPIEGAENPAIVVSPVDGTLSETGRIDSGRLIQAKGRTYTVSDLLHSTEEAAGFEEGTYLTIYLAPHNYHRIHHYTDGAIQGFRYTPGQLFPVNPFSVSHIQNLFPSNERLTTYIDHGRHKSAIVKVGATIVGKIKVTYDTIESNQGGMKRLKFFSPPIPAKKGDELGLFEMGSTVVLLFPKEGFRIDSNLKGKEIRLGQRIGEWI